MVNPTEFKKKIENMISQEYKVSFLGDNFEVIVNLLTEPKAEKMYNWIKEVIKRRIQPIVVGTDKHYKKWRICELLTFRYQFSIGNTEYRILFVKVKNSIYTKRN